MSDPALVNPVEEEQRSKSRVRIAMSAIYILLMATAVMLAILRGGAGNPADETIQWFVQWWWIPLLFALALGSCAILIDAMTPRKKLSGITGIFFGLIAGLLATVALSFVIDLIVQTSDALQNAAAGRIIMAVKAAFALTFCYLGASIVYATQDEFRLVIPYVEFSKQIRGTRPLVLDTSVIIDGRFNDIALTGFIAAPVIIPRFVIDELQALSDSSDRLKRRRGRRGLDMVRKLQNNPHIDLGIADENPLGAGVDQKLLIYAQQHQAYLVTTDFNLNKVASIHAVKVLNVNDLANALKPTAVPGERMQIEIIKPGEGAGQGVGYLDDGTMVVVENAGPYTGQYISCTVTSSIQTSAGRMIFGELENDQNQPAPHSISENTRSLPTHHQSQQHQHNNPNTYEPPNQPHQPNSNTPTTPPPPIAPPPKRNKQQIQQPAAPASPNPNPKSGKPRSARNPRRSK